MKKMLCLAIVFCLILSGCASQTKPAPNVTVLEHNAIAITKAINNATDGYEIVRGDGETNFSVSKKDFVAELNKRTSPKGYPELTILPAYGSYNRMYSLNSDTWYLLIDASNGGIEEITLSLYANCESDSKRNGDYLYILMDMFNPGMQELISSELLIFDEAPEDFPRVREVICGNTTYRYTLGDNLIITATPLPENPKEKIPSAIKPS